MEHTDSEYSGNRSRDLAKLVGSIAKEDGLFETNWPGLVVSRISTPFPRQPVSYKPSLCIVVQGQKQIFLGDREYVYNPFQYLVVPVALPLEMEISKASHKKPLLGLGLELDLTIISKLLLNIDDSLQPFPSIKPNQSTLFISRTNFSLQDALIRLLRLLPNTIDLKILGPSIVREILYRILQSEQGSLLRSLVFRDGASHRIARLIGFLNDNYDKKLSIPEIARFTGMSDSALHHKFREVTNMSPLQYLKKIRLHHARTMMVDRGLNATEAGFHVGYTNPSQFSREFKSFFGLAPRQLLKSMTEQ